MTGTPVDEHGRPQPPAAGDELATLLGVSPTFLPWPVALGMVALGAILGALTALISLRKMVAV